MRISPKLWGPADLEESPHEGFSLQYKTVVFKDGPLEWRRVGEYETEMECREEIARWNSEPRLMGQQFRIVKFKYENVCL